jgi:hypothetical protein
MALGASERREMRALDRTRRLVAVACLLSTVGVYCAFVGLLYAAEPARAYVPVITWLEHGREEFSHACMLALGGLAACAFLLNVDVYHEFIGGPYAFYAGSTGFTVGLVAVVMQAHTVGDRPQHDAWTCALCVAFLVAMAVYTARSWALRRLRRVRGGLLAMAAASATTHAWAFAAYRDDRSDTRTLTAAAVGQNAFLMAVVVYYATTIRELWPARASKELPLVDAAAP